MVGENDLEFETNQTREKERLVSTSYLFYFILFYFFIFAHRPIQYECFVLCQRLAHFIYIKLLRLRVCCAHACIYL